MYANWRKNDLEAYILTMRSSGAGCVYGPAAVRCVFVFVAHQSLVSEKYGVCTTCGFHQADDGLGNSPSHSVTRPKKSTDVRIEQSLIAKITTP